MWQECVCVETAGTIAPAFRKKILAINKVFARYEQHERRVKVSCQQELETGTDVPATASNLTAALLACRLGEYALILCI
jgi:hypothetical protein